MIVPSYLFHARNWVKTGTICSVSDFYLGYYVLLTIASDLEEGVRYNVSRVKEIAAQHTYMKECILVSIIQNLHLSATSQDFYTDHSQSRGKKRAIVEVK